MEVIFLILKIIGIILLVILGILVAVFNIVLLLPAKYHIKANVEGDIQHANISAKAFWLFHLLSISASYVDGAFHWKARIFWNKYSEETEPAKESIPETVEDANEKTTDQSEKVKEEQPPVSKPKIKKERNKFKQWIEKIKYTFKEICVKIKWILKNKDEFLAFINDENHRMTLRKIKKDVFAIIKHYRPRKIKGYLNFGMEDPYRTGQVLAALSLIYPFYGKEFSIYPNFEEKVLEGDLFVAGRVRAIHFLRMVKYFIFDKTFRDIYKYIIKFIPKK